MKMNTKSSFWRQIRVTGGIVSLLGATLVLVSLATRDSEASIFKLWRSGQGCNGHDCGGPESVVDGTDLTGELGETWYWMRSPEEEKRVVMGLYNRYCIRCHGVDGRGVWDIPNVPNFTNARWQACRTDGQLTRAIWEGRGACMPPFRGTLTLEQAWAIARYLRTFIPGTEVSPPILDHPEKAAAQSNK
jgi:hypothetical protein